MRDLHKVKEQEGFVLSSSQIYTLLGLLAAAVGLSFVLGFYLGRGNPLPAAEAPDPLIPPDVQNESVAMLLARAAEDEAAESERAQVELQFHDILPARTGEGAEAPRPSAPDAAAKPEASSTAGGDGATESAPEEGAPAENGPAGERKETAKSATEAPGREEAKGTAATATATRDDKAAREAEKREAEKAAREAKSQPAGGTREEKGAGGKTAEVAVAAKTPAAKKESEKGEAGKTTRATPTPAPGKTESSAREPEKATAKVDTRPASEPKVAVKTSSEASKPAVKKPEAEAPSKPEKSSGKGYTVQVSSYQESGVADKLVRQLMAQGFSAYKVAAEVNGHTWYRVRVGSFDSRDGAEREMQRLKAARSELNPMIAHR